MPVLIFMVELNTILLNFGQESIYLNQHLETGKTGEYCQTDIGRWVGAVDPNLLMRHGLQFASIPLCW